MSSSIPRQILVTGAGRGGTNLAIEVIRSLGIECYSCATSNVEDRGFFEKVSLPISYATKLTTENKNYTYESLCSSLEKFPNLKILFITRHPFDNVLSKIVRGAPKSAGGDNGSEEVMEDGTLFGAIQSVVNAYTLLDLLKNSKYSERLKIIKMEDLVTMPKETVDEVADFLEVTPRENSYLFYRNNRNRYQSNRYSGNLDHNQVDLYTDLDNNFKGFFQDNKNIIMPFIVNKTLNIAINNNYSIKKFRDNKILKKVYFGINGQFGDIIIQEPSLRCFINNNPDTKIVLGCNSRYQEALELYRNYHPNIVGFKIWDGYNNWPEKNDKKFIKEQDFDLIFNAQPKHTSQNWAKYVHQTVESGLMQGVVVSDTQIRLNKPPGIVKHEKTVAISLFPDWPNYSVKSLSIEDVTNIVQVVNRLGYKVVHLNGPNEPDIPNATKINGTYLDSVKNLLGTDLLITCDTGMSWVSSAYQHPTIGLYAWGYNPVSETSKNWQPTNPNADYLEARLAKNILKKEIVSLIVRRLR